MKLMRNFLAAVIAWSIIGCSSPSLSDYQQTTPQLNLEEFFNGELTAYGMVLDRGGKLTRRFRADLVASWEADKGVIDEVFYFDDGEQSTRVWRLTKTAPNQYQGEAGDVIGIATGETSGSALYWQYDMTINVDGTDYQVTLDDWMYLLDDKRLFNKTDILKFGFKVGEIVLFIEKKGDS